MDRPLKQIWVRKGMSLETTSGPVRASSWDVSPAKPGSRQVQCSLAASLNASPRKLAPPHCRQLCAKPAVAPSPSPAPGMGVGELGPMGKSSHSPFLLSFIGTRCIDMN